MRPRRSTFRHYASHPTVLGVVVLILAFVGLYLSYTANRGLPFVPRYTIYTDLPDAASLTRGTSEVRIGAGRVGLVTEITAMPGASGEQPYARVKLTLNQDVGPLPADTVAEVRPRSILGAKYLDLRPGTSHVGIPEGGTLRRTRQAVEFDDAFAAFDRRVRRGLRGTVHALGDAFAGRGTDFNRSVEVAASLLGPFDRVARVLADPDTALDGFIRGAAVTTGALARVAPELGSLIDTAATTLQALDAAGPALGRSLELSPSTEAVAARALRHARPVLGDAVAIVHQLRRATPLLPRAVDRIDRAVAAGIPALHALHDARIAALAERVGRSLAALARLKATTYSLKELTETVTNVSTALQTLLPLQANCNGAGVWARNVAQTNAAGDTSGNWLNALVVFDLDLASSSNFTLQSSRPSPRMHANPYPRMEATECESGNEPFAPGQVIGNPAGAQAGSTADTKPPPGVRGLARKAGLLR